MSSSSPSIIPEFALTSRTYLQFSKGIKVSSLGYAV
jgi:hypothetical protein